MTAPRTGPCAPWVDETDLCEPCSSYDFPADVIERAMVAASGLLYEWSGGQFPGECEETVRPCSRSHLRDRPHGQASESGWGIARALCGCSASSRCACSSLREIALGRFPLVDVGPVIVADSSNPAWPGSATLSSSLYRVDEYKWLVRLPNPDGSRPGWPCSQRLDLPPGEEDTFAVTLTWGREPPEEGVMAAAALACEMALACDPDTAGKCRLPRRAVSIIRQGVSMTFEDPTRLFVRTSGGQIQTGLWEVDAFLDAHNPRGIRRAAAIMSPDTRPASRRTGT